jgi:delta24(24(1))-sterol reductase
MIRVYFFSATGEACARAVASMATAAAAAVPPHDTEDRDRAKQVDGEVVMEFGGPLGCLCIMLLSPVLMYYFWACLEYYQGALQYPGSQGVPEGLVEFLGRMWDHIVVGAAPTEQAFTIYTGFMVFEAVIAVLLPGPVVEGLPIPSEGFRKLKYLCNGISCWYTTCLVSFLLHWYDIFDLTTIIDNLGHIMTWSIIWGNVVTLLTYLAALAFHKSHRTSGNHLYDIFMGAWLNPRIGPLDLKMWAEIRIPWVLLFYISLSAALKQYRAHGYVSAPMAFMVLAHALYVNACHKGEECIPTTWDIFYEKWGYMLIFWNLSGVPFLYCHSSHYLIKANPEEMPLPWIVSMYVLLLVGYYIWDTANSQKNRFRMQLKGTYIERRTFPQLPWGTLRDPPYIKTAQGSLLLTGGWWGIARKIHYTADLMMAFSWGGITGFGSFIPYFYLLFFIAVLTHRVSRDMQRCSAKYGRDWERYCQRVPYIFIPYVF